MKGMIEKTNSRLKAINPANEIAVEIVKYWNRFFQDFISISNCGNFTFSFFESRSLALS